MMKWRRSRLGNGPNRFGNGQNRLGNVFGTHVVLETVLETQFPRIVTVRDPPNVAYLFDLSRLGCSWWRLGPLPGMLREIILVLFGGVRRKKLEKYGKTLIFIDFECVWTKLGLRISICFGWRGTRLAEQQASNNHVNPLVFTLPTASVHFSRTSRKAEMLERRRAHHS